MEDGTVDIKGIDKAELLAALYNGSRPMGMGFLRAQPGNMTTEEAREAIGAGDDHKRDFGAQRGGLYFDYLHGRPLKIEIGGDTLRTALYNRDNGSGAAERIVSTLRKQREAA